MRDTFRSLRIHNYRLWAGGSLVSNIGTWMQRTAQTWLVLTELTRGSVAAVGIVTALQYTPLLFLLPWTGLAADRLDRRKLLIATQAAMGLLALLLGTLRIAGVVQLWHVYVFALALGAVTAFDSPAAQAFAGELVGEEDLTNAIALNSTTFNAARMIGPALAGVLISLVGSGGVFLINAASFAVVITSLCLLRKAELHRSAEPVETPSGLVDAVGYVWARPSLRVVMVMLALIGTFALNFPLLIAAMSVKVLGVAAGHYGLLMSVLAVGSIVGALTAAGRSRPTLRGLAAGAGLLALGFVLGALAPGYWSYAFTLVLVGGAAVSFLTNSNAFLQLESEPAMRGRVLSLRIALAVGGAPLGAPLLGWTADTLGPRAALAVAGIFALLAALAAASYSHRRAQH